MLLQVGVLLGGAAEDASELIQLQVAVLVCVGSIEQFLRAACSWVLQLHCSIVPCSAGGRTDLLTGLRVAGECQAAPMGNTTGGSACI